MGDDMKIADILYRANRIDRSEVTLRLQLPRAAATVVDCWERLTTAHGPIDPRTIEIEIREQAHA
jgi:hypothetical protein